MELRICILPARCSLKEKSNKRKYNATLNNVPYSKFSWFKIVIAKISSDE